MAIVPINQAEIMIAAALGEMRHRAAVEAGYYRQMGATPEDDILTDRNGIIGEIAFGKWGNVFVDFSFDPRRGGCDFVLHGRRIDVKTARNEGRGLTIDAWKIDHHGYSDVDTFVLAEFLPGREYAVADGEGGMTKIAAPHPGGMLVNLVGHIDVAEFKSMAKPIKFASGRDAFAVTRDDLSPMTFL